MPVWPIAKNVCLGLAAVCMAAALLFVLLAASGDRHHARRQRRIERWLMTVGLALACVGWFGEATIRSLVE